MSDEDDPIRVGRRVRFENPELPIRSSDQDWTNTYLRGRITYMDDPLIQVIPDGRTFAFWLDLQKTEVLPE